MDRRPLDYASPPEQEPAWQPVRWHRPEHLRPLAWSLVAGAVVAWLLCRLGVV